MPTPVNEYLCVIERNQNGKYCVRIRAAFGVAKRGGLVRVRTRHIGAHPGGGWSLPVYFLASSFGAAMKKLEETLQLLQKIPVDPMTGTTDWGLKRAGPQGGIFDVYTKSEATAGDGTNIKIGKSCRVLHVVRAVI